MAIYVANYNALTVLFSSDKVWNYSRGFKSYSEQSFFLFLSGMSNCNTYHCSVALKCQDLRRIRMQKDLLSFTWTNTNWVYVFRPLSVFPTFHFYDCVFLTLGLCRNPRPALFCKPLPSWWRHAANVPTWEAVADILRQLLKIAAANCCWHSVRSSTKPLEK